MGTTERYALYEALLMWRGLLLRRHRIPMLGNRWRQLRLRHHGWEVGFPVEYATIADCDMPLATARSLGIPEEYAPCW